MTAVILIILAVLAAIVVGLMFGMLKRMLVMLAVIAVTAGLIFGLKFYWGYQMYKGMMAADHRQTVSTVTAARDDWQPRLETVGSLRAAKGVDITSEIPGIVENIRFTSGSDVTEGTVLVSLRAADDIARLHSLEASAKLTEITWQRDKKQFEVKAISQATLDIDAAALDSARAQVAQQKAVVDKKFLRAPFSGHLGIRNVDLGQYVTPGASIVTLQEFDSIYLDFILPQQAFAQLGIGQDITAKNDTWPNRTFAGRITAINPKVDPATRNMQVRATIDNTDHALLPGMYATAEIKIGKSERFITLPQTAITYNPYGNTVYLIQNKGKDDKGGEQLLAQQAIVRLGETRGDQVQVLAGLKEGDVVVTSGQIKLQNGTPVIINNSLTPKNDANPEPKDE